MQKQGRALSIISVVQGPHSHSVSSNGGKNLRTGRPRARSRGKLLTGQNARIQTGQREIRDWRVRRSSDEKHGSSGYFFFFCRVIWILQILTSPSNSHDGVMTGGTGIHDFEREKKKMTWLSTYAKTYVCKNETTEKIFNSFLKNFCVLSRLIHSQQEVFAKFTSWTLNYSNGWISLSAHFVTILNPISLFYTAVHSQIDSHA